MTAPVPAWLKRLVAAALIAAATAFAFVREVHAQGAASITADVSIATTALAVGTTMNVRFGDVVPAVPVTIDARTNVNAGQFVIQGTRNAEVAVTMTLPTLITTGVWTMPISFGPTAGCYRRQPGQNACSYWDPSTVLVEKIRNSNPPNNHLWVWIGGTVSPGAAQNPGVYYGAVTLSVVYTGN